MANHRSALKRLKQNLVRKKRNSYYHKSTRTAIKELQNINDRLVAQKKITKVFSMIDKLVKRHIIHKNKASNLKSNLSHALNNL